MMDFSITTYYKDHGFYPEGLREVSGPPTELYHRGADLAKLLQRPKVAIVGNRAISTYGKRVTTDLASQLAEQGVLIISGLAFGVDSTAHEAALDIGGLTMAVLPSPVDRIAPSSNHWLANKILQRGGALISEYPSGSLSYKEYFVARNRLVAGLADVLIITEAADNSGSLHTAGFAHDMNKTVMAVPGNITNRGAAGVNNLLKVYAHPVTTIDDVLLALHIEPHRTSIRHLKGRNAAEQLLLDLLVQGVSSGDELLKQSQLDISHYNQTLTMLEIGLKVRPLGNNYWTLY